MALIVPYQSQQGIAVGNAGQAAQYRKASEFMTPGQENLGRGMQQLAQGMDKLGGVMFDAEIQKRQQQNATDLLADQNAEKDAFRAFDAEYKRNNKGASARDAVAAYETYFNERHQGLQNKWGGNPRLMHAVDTMFSPIRQAGLSGASAYSISEEEDYAKQEVAARELDVMRDAADPSMPYADKLNSLADLENTMRMMAKGRNIEPELAAVRQNFALEHMQNLMAANRFKEARSYVEQNKDMFGAKTNDALEKIKTTHEAARKKWEAEKSREQKDAAYKAVYDMPPQQAIEYVTSPAGMQALGLRADQAQDVAGMVYTNWSHRKSMEKESREAHADKIATEALNLAVGANGQQKDPVSALTLVRDSNLDGYAKAKAIKLIQEDKLGNVNNPQMVEFLTSGILNGSVNSTESIDIALLSGDINKDDHTALRQLYADAKGQMKDALGVWESVVKDAYARSVYQNGTPSEAQAKSRALFMGSEIIRKKFKEGGMGAAQAWVVSKEAKDILEGTQATMRDVMEDTSKKLFGAGNKTTPVSTPSSVPETSPAQADTVTRRPGESLPDYQARRKMQKYRGAQ